MNIVVLMKMVPDTVEELEIDASGKALDSEWLRFIPNESDDHALEQALILKEKYGGQVTVMAIDAPEIDDALYAAIAKGADRAIKISCEVETLNSLTAAKIFASALQDTSFDLYLTGVQAIDDLDGQVAPFLASFLKLPYLGVITGVSFDEESQSLSLVKEFAGGLRGEFEAPLPVILGIQAAEKPPRYVPVAKIRGAMRSVQIESLALDVEPHFNLEVKKMYKPVVERAEIIEGSPEEVAAKIYEILAKRGLLKEVGA